MTVIAKQPISAEQIAKKMLAEPFRHQKPIEKLTDPISDQSMVVTLDQLKTYEHNPRRTRNPKYDEIKQSILSRGLDQPPPITKRPGESHYIIRNGGNTRLAILKELWEETKDERFYRIQCLFKPWESEISTLVGHLAENELHGELKFIEKALAVSEMKKLYEEDEKQKISTRNLIERLKEDGYPISKTLAHRMLDCVDYLLPAIPELLYAGLGRPRIEELIIFRNQLQKIWEHYLEKDEEQFSHFWINTLTLSVQNFEDISEYAFEQIKDEFIGRLAQLTGSEYNTLQLDLISISRGEELIHSEQEEDDEEEVEYDEYESPLAEELIATNNTINKKAVETTTEPATIQPPLQSNTVLTTDSTTTASENQAIATEEQQQAFLAEHIVEVVTTSPRVQLINQQIENQLGGELPVFTEAVLKSIPVQAGSGLAEVSDLWYISKQIDTPEGIRDELYRLIYDIACYGNYQQNLIQTNEGLGFGVTTNNQQEKNQHTDMIALLIMVLLRLHENLPETEQQKIISALFGQMLLGAYDLDIGTNKAISIGMEKLPDVLLVKLFRFIRLARRLVDLCKNTDLQLEE